MARYLPKETQKDLKKMRNPRKKITLQTQISKTTQKSFQEREIINNNNNLKKNKINLKWARSIKKWRIK